METSSRMPADRAHSRTHSAPPPRELIVHVRHLPIAAAPCGADGGGGCATEGKQAIIDGEVTVLGAAGLPGFQALRRGLGKSTRLIDHAFDLLHLAGKDLCEGSAPRTADRKIIQLID